MESTGQKRRKFADGCFPSWSPDGKTLYYHSHHEKKLKAAPVDTGDVTAARTSRISRGATPRFRPTAA